LSINENEKKNGNRDRPASEKQVKFLKKLRCAEFEMANGITSKDVSDSIEESLTEKDLFFIEGYWRH
jgi:hypothetical protein